MLQRERAVRQLRTCVLCNPDRAAEAWNRIEAYAQSGVAARNARKRENLVRKLGMLEVAKMMVLDPGGMQEEVGPVISPDSPPSGVDWFAVRFPRRLHKWEQETLARTGTIDPSDSRALENYGEHISRAREANFDVAGSPALDAYTYALHAFWSEGKTPQEYFLREHDPDLARDESATPVQLMIEQWCGLLEKCRKVTLEDREWWDLGVLLLFALDELFDVRLIESGSSYEWRLPDPNNNLANGRSNMLGWSRLYLGSVEARDAAIMDALIRATEHISCSVIVASTPSPSIAMADASAGRSTDAASRPTNLIHVLRNGCKIRWNGGEEMLFPSRPGFKYLAILIENQGKRIDACALEAPRPGEAPETYSGQDLLDEEAIKDLRKSARDLASKISAAKEAGDEAELARLKAEAMGLDAEYKRSTRLGGVSRQAGSPESLKRDRVRKRIMAAIGFLGEQSEELHAHIVDSIQDPSGANPGYCPKTPVDWAVEYTP